MRRKVQLFLLLLLVAASTESGVQASTDCERWIATYKTQLEHAKAVKRMQAAHARLKQAAQRKMAVYVKKPAPVRPKPVRPFLVSVPKPKLTPEQMLERFNLLCGDLPEEPKNETTDKVLAGPDTPEFVAEMTPPFLPRLPTVTETDDELIPPNLLPPYVPTGTGGSSYMPPVGGGIPVFGGGGGGGGNGGQVTPSGGGDTPPTIPGIVPEPGSLSLILTGVAGAAGVVRRRRYS